MSQRSSGNVGLSTTVGSGSSSGRVSNGVSQRSSSGHGSVSQRSNGSVASSSVVGSGSSPSSVSSARGSSSSSSTGTLQSASRGFGVGSKHHIKAAAHSLMEALAAAGFKRATPPTLQTARSSKNSSREESVRRGVKAQCTVLQQNHPLIMYDALHRLGDYHVGCGDELLSLACMHIE